MIFIDAGGQIIGALIEKRGPVSTIHGTVGK